MNAHPIDSIPAFVLGALDHDQMLEVSAHLSACDTCRVEAAAFYALIEAPADIPRSPGPPAHVKQQLFARIASGESHRQAALARRQLRWPIALLACLLVLTLGFGYMLADARSQLITVADQLAQSRLASERLRAELELNEQAASFISQPQTQARRLASPGQRASAVMYMQAGSRHAVLIVRDMPKIEPGQIYQFWLASPGQQVPANTFEVDQNGAATLAIEAPAPVDWYEQVMVTVEQNGGSAQPSEQIVVSGALASRPSLPGSLAIAWARAGEMFAPNGLS